MGVFFLIVFFLVSFLIVGLVLLQEGKGGGLTGMSTGMDGVMGAKNPLRRLTAYLFAFFVLMAITINWYFHQRVDNVIPLGAEIQDNTQRVLEESAPLGDINVAPASEVPEGSLRPEASPEAPPADAPESGSMPAAPVDAPETPEVTDKPSEAEGVQLPSVESEVLDRMNETAEKAEDGIRDAAESASQAGAALVDKAGDAVDAAAEKAEAVAGEAAEKIDETVEKAEEAAKAEEAVKAE